MFLNSTAFGGFLDISLALREDVYKVSLKRRAGETFGIMVAFHPEVSGMPIVILRQKSVHDQETRCQMGGNQQNQPKK